MHYIGHISFFDLNCKFAHNMHMLCWWRCWIGRAIRWRSCFHYAHTREEGGFSRALGKAGCWRLTCVQIDFLST